MSDLRAIEHEAVGTAPGFFRYWGKADDAGLYHPLACHCLDVAAVGVALAEARPGWLDAFARVAEMKRSDLESVIAFLLALHDLGKFGDGFQYQRRDIAARLGRAPACIANHPRHDSLGYMLWSELADPRSEKHAPIVRVDVTDADGTTPDALLVKKALWSWLAAVTGHHGRPPEMTGSTAASLNDHFFLRRANGAWLDAVEFVAEARAVLAPAVVSRLPIAAPISEDSWRRSSWWLAGYATLCDWVGSNRDWFPFDPAVRDLRSYWSTALKHAHDAVRTAGLVAPQVRSFGGFGRLFEKIERPSPLQVEASSVRLGEGPQLFLLEDLTGSGKTEAALTLVARLFDAGKADGFYFALPTMATANAMCSRVEPLVDRLFEPTPPASFVLAHSGPKLSGRTTGIGAETLERQAGSTYGPEEPTASALARSWLGDSRKKALLADAGVGTVDQALVGALQAKHNSLRLLGLHRHVLVVDEVHACDVYMNGVLMELLRLQAACGGSAVLLSATLPMAGRRQLVQAFRQGLGARDAAIDGDAYPALVRADRSGVDVVPVDACSGCERILGVSFFDAIDAVAGWCVDQARAGKAVAWIRNTVRDALEAYDRLARELGRDRVQLFHARFPMGDRLEIERDIVGRFGPTSDAIGREGRIVVATQVLEQSLDLDFDEMVSDLAPIDRLIQRAGRLHRHARGERGDAVLHVLGPAWNERPEEGWPGGTFKGTVAVYGRPSVLWRTQRVLHDLGRLELPAKARELVEAVYGPEDGDSVPEVLALERRELNAEGEALRNKAMAEHNKINLDQGYLRTGATWADDEFVPTRLGEPTVTLRLVRSIAGEVCPWSAATSVSQGVRWRLGEVSVRTALACAGRPDEEDPLRARLAQLGAEPPAHVAPIEMHAVHEEWHGRGVAARGDDRQAPVTIVFTPGRGLDFRLEKGL
ncbi:MAG: CRISPR-associated helicase Cas3' [Deltaproteobacteria bacterium]|nr:CRISPR-associated helicase Cas3' [Deltaproteobacteria bacterium]